MCLPRLGPSLRNDSTETAIFWVQYWIVKSKRQCFKYLIKHQPISFIKAELETCQNPRSRKRKKKRVLFKVIRLGICKRSSNRLSQIKTKIKWSLFNKKKKQIVSIHLALFVSLKLKTKTTRFIARACSRGLIRFSGLAREFEARF